MAMVVTLSRLIDPGAGISQGAIILGGILTNQ
jgi:hypothetical protein